MTTHSTTPDPFAPGGLYDTTTVTNADRGFCYLFGHVVESWGTLYGWCHRCKHTVWAYDRRSVLCRGEYHRYPPRHEAST